MSNGSSIVSTTSPLPPTQPPVTSIWPQEQPFDHTVHDVFGILTILVSIVTLTGDVFLLMYFLTKKRRPSTLIYYALLICDLVISLTGIYIGIDSVVYSTTVYKRTILATKEVVVHPKNALIDSNITRHLNSYFFAVFSRMSAMINCYLSVIRCIVILSPFTNINVWAMLGTLAFYLLILIVSIAVFFNIDSGALCSHLWMTCEPEIKITHGNSSYSSGLEGVLILTGIPFVAPCVPVMLSCLLIILKQLSSDKQFGEKMRAGTITIVYVSFLFLVCNAAYLIFTFVQFYKIYPKEGESHIFDYDDIALFYAFRTFATFVNALGNVIILLLRSSGVKDFVKQVLKREITLEEILDPKKRERRQTACTITDVSAAKRISAQIVRLSQVSAPRMSEIQSSRPAPVQEETIEETEHDDSAGHNLSRNTSTDLHGDNLSDDTTTITSMVSSNMNLTSKGSAAKTRKRKLTKAEKKAARKSMGRQHDMIILGLGESLDASLIFHNSSASNTHKSDRSDQSKADRSKSSKA